MKYNVETHFGCTSDAIIVNGKHYFSEDQRYGLTDEERHAFHGALLQEIAARLNRNEIGALELLQLLPIDRVEFSPTCEQCGDSVTSTYFDTF